MEDNYFDKKLRDIFENPPAFELDPLALADMRQRLEIDQKKRRGIPFWLWWLIPICFLPFIFGTFFFYYKYQNLNDKINTLNSQFVDFQKDTLIKTHFIYQFDTIYNTVYKDVIIERKQFTSASFISRPIQNGQTLQHHNPAKLNLHFTPQRGMYSLLNSADVFGLQAYQNEKLTNNAEPLEIPFYVPDYLKNQLLHPLTREPALLQLTSRLNEAKPDLSDPKTSLLRKLIYYGKPEGFRIDGSMSPMIIGISDTGFSGREWMLSGGINFKKGLSFHTGVSLLSVNFKEKENFDRYPPIDPENPVDVLQEVYGDFTYLQIPIGVQKTFRLGKKLRPSVGLDLVVYRSFRQKFTYEFIGNLNEYKRSQTFKNGQFYYQNIRTSFGVDFEISKHLIAHTDAYFQYSFENVAEAFFPLRYFGWQLGLGYQF